MGSCCINGKLYAKEMDEKIPSHVKYSYKKKDRIKRLEEYYDNNFNKDYWVKIHGYYGMNDSTWNNMVNSYLLSPRSWKNTKCCISS